MTAGVRAGTVTKRIGGRLRVLKIGGSVIRGGKAYAHVAARLRDRLARDGGPLLVVVSAESGTTDALLAEARALMPKPPAPALDLLWCTGELRSVALLGMALHAVGVRAAALNVHQTGVRVTRRGVEVRPERVRRALLRHAVVVVPGFLGISAASTIVSLGRGGSDLSAVLLARALGAAHCELIKDVPGFFTKDPNRHCHAEHLPQVTYGQALEQAESGCALVQRRAIEAAEEGGCPLIIRTLDDAEPCTVVGASDNQASVFRLQWSGRSS